MKNKVILRLFIGFTALLLLLPTASTYALTPARPNITPGVTSITNTTATIAVTREALASIGEDKDRDLMFFEYYERGQMCIMIYPAPEACRPKVTTRGNLSATLTNLKPSTEYSVVLKRDVTETCITTPCPTSSFESDIATFTTLGTSSINPYNRNLSVGSRGSDVISLQTFLNERGYLAVNPTGYYGLLTRAAVRKFQQNDMRIIPTGTVGPKTRAALVAWVGIAEETFSGKATAISTDCYFDGVCSVIVDGKKVVTTIGWTQGPVGGIKGKDGSVIALDELVGETVTVYAKKTTDGYTLYGRNSYYVQVN